MPAWLNNDSLYIKYGTAEATAGVAGEVGESNLRETEYVLDLTLLNTSTPVILDDNVNIGKVRIEQVVVEVEVAATSGGAATLSVGLMRNDRTTVVSNTALVNAAALATLDTAGKKLTLITGATAAGGLIGTTLANADLVTALAGTAVFTAGKLRVRIFWYPL